MHFVFVGKDENVYAQDNKRVRLGYQQPVLRSAACLIEAPAFQAGRPKTVGSGGFHNEGYAVRFAAEWAPPDDSDSGDRCGGAGHLCGGLLGRA
jgi:hypothetical protein